MIKAVKAILLVMLTISLGVGVLYCINRVGSLNSHAEVLKACMAETSRSDGCPSIPVTSGQISSLHQEANTLGNLGWVGFWIMIAGVGASALDVLTSDDSEAEKSPTRTKEVANELS